jgi:hypothetical protein
MKMKLFFANLVVLASLSAPAHALTFVNSGATSSVTVAKTDLLKDFHVLTDGSTADSDGLFAKITFELISFTSNSFTFNYQVINESVSPAANSRLGQFGFDVSPGLPGGANNGNFTLADGAGDYFEIASNNNGNFNGLGGREVCLTAQGGNCNGGGNDGILSGLPNSKIGQLIFTYAGAQNEISFSNFVTRWQAGQNASSASGGSFAIVPEPATWAMMIGGFGMIGGALRRRRSTSVALTA